MFSNDQNVETIGQLIETLKHYASLQGEYLKLDIVEKVVRILTAIAIISVISLLSTLTLIYLGFATAHALEPLVGIVSGYAIVAGIYLLILLLFIMFKKQWIEKPLVKFLASLLLSK
ncbi:hypothetical protein HMPREF1640_03250 [Prevotella sp. S7-1-8]|jgi:hypothetical protein|uniref:phage holin family protein n=1 Tax=Prevotella sp. S7-1-8 TaxID=1284775 RepID=UPI00050F1D62|nr:phage holin family protein [Prevotella sp. S7-1-8]KGF18663.1 hypothetical protein HMPREF1640_03250 [Prevotella sp. S7-1-8]